MKRLFATLFLMSGFSAAYAETTVLECARLVDVERGKVLENRQVLIEGKRITAVGKNVSAAADAKRITLDTCLPGLMDMHVHLAGQMSRNGYIKRFQNNAADQALLANYYANITLQAGFTTVRNLGDSYNVTVALRNAISQGVATGPRIYTAAKSLATTGGHADPTNGFRKDLMGDPGPADGVVNSAEEARKAVRQRYKDGADMIKITATGGVLSLAKDGQNPQFTLEEIEAVVQTAKDYGMPVAAHSHGTEGMKRAVLAGVTSIEHGTNALEFIYMVEGGMPEMVAIQAATMTAARLIGMENELGSISQGKLADIVAVKGNPLEDISLLSDIAFVMKDGEVYKK